MSRIVGARGVALRDVDGQLVGSHGATPEMIAQAEQRPDSWDVLTLTVPSGTLTVWTNAYAPYFGREELALLRTLGALAGLALDRVRLFAEERDARDALERANEIMAGFVALASHELRTPVAAISGLAETLVRRSGELDAVSREQLEGALLAQGDHMRVLVDQLLDLSRLDAEAVELRPEPVQIRPMLERLVATVAAERASEVSVEADQDLEVTLDLTALERIVANLVTNALRYGGTPVRVSAQAQDRHFRLAVEDHGPGVPGEFVPSLFERFSRSNASRERAGGTGLGLAIARSYAQAHGGDLLYEPGQPTGACFRLVIPLQPGTGS